MAYWDDDKIKRKKNIDHHGPKPSFSLVPTFKGRLFAVFKCLNYWGNWKSCISENIFADACMGMYLENKGVKKNGYMYSSLTLS
jgi:hypothetical protein